MALFYQNQQLTMGSVFGKEGGLNVNLTEFSKNKKTPFYFYHLGLIEERYQLMKKSLPGAHIHYAVKANANLNVLKKFQSLGAGADVVSAGEAQCAIEAGIRPENIVFSGVAKTKEELTYAFDHKIGQINVESPQELQRIAEMTRARGGANTSETVQVAFRMNPDVDPETHAYIRTGFRENKFGMDESFLPELVEILKQNPHVKLVGLTLHIGSQLLSLKALQEAIEKTILVYQALKAQGFHDLKKFDVGGGVGIFYEENESEKEFQLMADYGKMVSSLLGPLGCEIQCEPGRFLVARAGVLVTEVQYVKKTKFKNFLIVDSGMHHLIRPALYQAYHRIFPLTETNRQELSYDVVGPICESSDFFAKNRRLSEVLAGEKLVLAESGAYGYSMASLYNAHSLPDEYAGGE